MPDPRPVVLIIIPSYGHFEYVARAARTAYVETLADDVRPLVLVVDDASPEVWAAPGLRRGTCPDVLEAAMRDVPAGHWASAWFEDHGGLLRSLNHGLRLARDTFDYAVCGNSDLVFTPGWFRGVKAALDAGWDLVGPVTNAPGTEDHQYVGHYLADYRVADDAKTLHRQADQLYRLHKGGATAGPLNGFCLAAKTATWWAHAYDDRHVFCPRNDVNSKGEPNPTPLMTLGEYELQARWRRAGLRTGVAISSFVFHYRSVSRGDKYRGSRSVRMARPS